MGTTKTKKTTRVAKSPSKRNGQFRTYSSALNYLKTMTDYETMSRVGYNHTNFNLSRMNRLLAGIEHPQKKIKTIHIAGTKGKGSTAAMVSNMLQACGYKVGQYTSPHVMDLRERIMVNDAWISEQDFVRLINKLLPAIERLKTNRPTFFEIMTAAAFLHFKLFEVDLAVIETGLGGRLDATNVIRPEVCGITSISLDHTYQLGNTLAEIAEEKGGILKEGVPAVSAPQHPEVKTVLQRMAKELNVPISFTGDDIEFSYRFESSRPVGPHTRVCISTPTSRFEHLHVPLLGEHQAINCGLALSLVDVLKNLGYKIDDQDIVTGLSRVNLPGRMEILHDNPKVLVDGAHNAASIEALMRTIGQNIPYDSMIVIFGCQNGKDIEGMIRHIQLGADKIIFTRSSSPQAADPLELSARYVEESGQMAQTAPTLAEAMSIARRAVTMDDLICITGSFYLVGDAKKLLAAES